MWTTSDFQRPRGGRSVPEVPRVAFRPRPHLGVDLDGVVYNFDVAMRDILNELGDYGLDEDSRYYDWLKDNVEREDWRKAWDDPRLYRIGPAYPGAADALSQLSIIADVTIITHRPERYEDATREWLWWHDVPYDDLIMVPRGTVKSACAIQRRCDAYVDDRVDVVLDYLEATDATVFAPVRAWNTYLEHLASREERLIMFNEWEEIVKWTLDKMS